LWGLLPQTPGERRKGVMKGGKGEGKEREEGEKVD